MIQEMTDQKDALYLLSQMTAFRSRWFVGSSSISKVGSIKRALLVKKGKSKKKKRTPNNRLMWDQFYSINL